MITEKITIKRIGPTSALKAGAVVGLAVGIALAIHGLISSPYRAQFNFQVIQVLGIIVVAILGGIFAMISSILFNIALNLTGGLQLEISVENDAAAASKRKQGPESLGSMMRDDK